MSGRAEPERDVDIDLQALGSAVWARKGRIAAIALGAAALAFAVSSLIAPRYQSETRLLIEAGETVFTQPASGAAPNGEAVTAMLDQQAVASQVEILKSNDLLRKIATDFDLASREEFDEAANLGLMSRTLVTFGLIDNPLDVPADLRVLKAMREKLEVFPVENSRVVVVEFSSEDPELAEKIPNALAQAYLSLQRSTKQATNADAAEFLQPEINALRDRVREAEARVADFKASADILDGQNQATLATQQLGELSSELSRVKANRSSAEATAEAIGAAIANGASLDSLPSVQSSGLIERLREKRVDLATQITELSVSLLDSHPRIKGLRSQLADLDVQIRIEAQKIVSGLETLAETARQREQQLVVDLNRLKSESARAETQNVELRALEREAEAQSQLLESYLARYREASARTDNKFAPADARVISLAPLPTESYFPKKLPITLAAFFAGLMAGVLGVLLAELFSGRAMRHGAPRRQPGGGEDDADHAVQGMPVEGRGVMSATPAETAPSLVGRRRVGATPSLAPGDIIPLERRVESIAEELIVSGAKRAVFVSPEGDIGAAGAVMIARRIADEGVDVVLADLTTSGIVTRIALEGGNPAGVTDLLCGTASVADALTADHFSAARIVARGQTGSAKAMRHADRLPGVLDQLDRQCEILVIECGAADIAMLDLVLGSDSDVARVIVSAIKPQARQAAAVIDALGGPDICMVVTPVVARRSEHAAA
jgi:uncharacterized protein involved in exopolysaccharide biosynthesis/Mrp family chromosome partitioning ATPase